MKHTINSSRWLSIVGYSASILTIVQSIVFLVLSSVKSKSSTVDFWTNTSLLMGVLLCVVALMILLINSQVKNEKLSFELRTIEKDIAPIRIQLPEIIKYTHNINHQLRQTIDDFYYMDPYDEINDEDITNVNIAEEEVCNTEIYLSSIEHKFRGFLQSFTTNVKGAFDSLTGSSSNSVYITIITSLDDNDCFVETFYRDPISYPRRSKIDALMKDEYNVNEFTPLKILMNNNSLPTCFACDDCLQYYNFSDRHDSWKEFYKACLAVPIRVRKDKSINEYRYLGFLLVDNNEGKLDNIVAKELICAYADVLYTPIVMYLDAKNELKYEKTNDNT